MGCCSMCASMLPVYMAVMAAAACWLYGLFVLRDGHGFDVPDSLHGWGAVVTGSTAGIGLEVAKEICRRGARVVINGPDPSRTQTAARVVKKLCAKGGRALPIPSDLSDFDQVRALAEQVEATLDAPLRLVFANAARSYVQPYYDKDRWRALWRRPKSEFVAKSGHDRAMATSHLGHFLLLSLLAPRLDRGARIVVTVGHAMWHGSFDHLMRDPGQRVRWDANRDRSYYAHLDAKLAGLCFGRALRRRRLRFGNATVVLHDPGRVQGNLAKYRERACDEQSCYTGSRARRYRDERLRHWHGFVDEGGKHAVQAAFVHPAAAPDVVAAYCMPPWALSWWYGLRGSHWLLGDVVRFRRSHTWVSEMFLDYQWLSWGPLHAHEGPQCGQEFEERFWEWSAHAVGVPP